MDGLDWHTCTYGRYIDQVLEQEKQVHRIESGKSIYNTNLDN